VSIKQPMMSLTYRGFQCLSICKNRFLGRIAVVFDPKDNELTDDIQEKICHAFEKALSDNSRFKLLERMNIHIIIAAARLIFGQVLREHC